MSTIFPVIITMEFWAGIQLDRGRGVENAEVLVEDIVRGARYAMPQRSCNMETVKE